MDKPPDLKRRKIHRSSDVLDYNSAFRFQAWKRERKWADLIMGHVTRNNLPLHLDMLTRGEGNCFMIAVMQQLQQIDVYRNSRKDVQNLADEFDHMRFRKSVKDFIKNSKDPRISDIKSNYMVAKAAGIETKSWDEYWETKMEPGTWADSYFLLASAYFLDKDLVIVDTACNPESPFYTINGTLQPSNQQPLILGLVTHTHFQSLLTTEINFFTGNNEGEEDIENSEQNNVNENLDDAEDAADDEIYISDNEDDDIYISDNEDDNIYFSDNEDGEDFKDLDQQHGTECPSCKKVFKNVLLHIHRSKACKHSVKAEDLMKLEEKSKTIYKAKQKRRKLKYQCKVKKELNKTSLTPKERKAKSIENLRKKDYQKVKEQQNARKAKSRALQKAKKSEKCGSIRSSLKKNEQEDPDTFKRKVKTEKSDLDRVREFRDQTMFGPIFVCVSCHGKMFKASVQKFTKKLAEEINEKIELETCIIDQNLMTKVEIDYIGYKEPDSFSKEKLVGESFICKTCLNYLRRGKLPPSSVMNNLQLHETDEDLKNQDHWLTELEAALISKNIIFQKIFQLPRSRWTGLKDRIINVPIAEESMMNTLVQLPRTPNEAALVGISLKRKLDMKNVHKKQLINPNRIFKVLHKLKTKGSPHHQNLHTPESFILKCAATDIEGFNLIFDDLQEELETMDTANEEELKDEIDDEEEKTSLEAEKDEEDWKINDPVKKYQFTYDESLCMVDKYPEISVAPGEGQKPKGILGDRHWDVKSFPHLHNPDGTNGKDQERKARLTDQRYFIQRVINKETRFAKSPAYLYASVAYLEERRLQQNINLVGSRGKKLNKGDGQVSYQLDDEYRVLENIPNTPKYWKKAKYEILAKLDNLGPFHIFFTLSCGELRWPPTFASILLDRGYSVRIRSCKTTSGIDPVTEARLPNGEWTPIMDFVKEHIDESLHELIRGNVVLATRYFHHRVKTFIKTIVMGGKMYVLYYTYKVEFQERGAAHIHGTLWLDLIKLEDLVVIDGVLQNPTEIPPDAERPLKGLKSVFDKLKSNQSLSKEDTTCLTNFIDAFITVRTDERQVGTDVRKIVREVNQHHHTKTCRKRGNSCRFNYPKPPSPYTIVAQPLNEKDPSKKSKILQHAAKTIKKVMDALEDDTMVNEIIEKYKSSSIADQLREVCRIAGVKYTDYINALGISNRGYSVVFERSLSEMFINPFNETWIRSWNANLDLQPVLDYFAVVTYVTDYYAKDDSGTMEILKNTLKDKDITDVQEKMKVSANVYLTHRQIGEAEAVFRLIPSLTLSMSNITCQFVPTGN